MLGHVKTCSNMLEDVRRCSNMFYMLEYVRTCSRHKSVPRVRIMRHCHVTVPWVYKKWRMALLLKYEAVEKGNKMTHGNTFEMWVCVMRHCHMTVRWVVSHCHAACIVQLYWQLYCTDIYIYIYIYIFIYIYIYIYICHTRHSVAECMHVAVLCWL